jgi:hypothetical protein
MRGYEVPSLPRVRGIGINPIRQLLLHVFLRLFFSFLGLLFLLETQAQRPIPPTTDYSGMNRVASDTTRPKAVNRKGKGSQIVDDSTKNIYGPKTALWTTEEDLFINRPNYRPLDTAITNYHRWTYFERFDFLYQDLGVNGTAMNSILPESSPVIGATPGFQVYEPYYNSEVPHYYNTKSPYSKFALVWGGNGRAQTKVEFSRNINPRWNFGFTYRPLLTDKQINRRGKGDRIVIHHSYDVYSTYTSKNEKYFLLGNFKRMRHRVRDTGGVLLNNPDSTYSDYFAQNAIQPFLSKAESEDFRTNLHVYQHYQLAKPFQVYHKLDLTYQENFYRDTPPTSPNLIYDTLAILNQTKANDRNSFHSSQNEVGIKGNAAFLFYNAYIRVRSFANFNPGLIDFDIPIARKGTETYVGGRLAFQFDSLSVLDGNAELLLDGNYRIQARLVTPWIEGYLLNTLTKPSFKSQIYRGTYDFWLNDFSNVNALHAKSFLKLSAGRFRFMPGVSYLAYNNFVFFEKQNRAGQKVLPRQSDGTQQVVMSELKFDMRFFKRMHLKPTIIYNSILQNSNDALVLPEVFGNIQLTYENKLFKGAIDVQIGVDAHYRPSYQAMGYDPAIQQYYVQRDFKAPEYWFTSIFFNGAFKRGKVFVKYNNILQPFLGYGFMPTPTYPGLRNSLDFGFDLILFD